MGVGEIKEDEKLSNLPKAPKALTIR